MTFDASVGGGIFVCPICSASLRREGNSLLCPARHTFDIAKSGQVNLLRRAAGLHGDNAQMVASRRAFLDKGYYAHLQTGIAEALSYHLPDGGVLLDSGCGEGYYTAKMAENKSFSVYGVDISSAAAAKAAKKAGVKGIAVASAYELPVASASCDALTNIFAPFCREEFFRVLKSGGILIDAIPAERHLFELKEAIYETPYENILKPTEIEGFLHIETRRIEKKILLKSREDIASLMMMTPYFYRTDREGLARAEAIDSIGLTASFYLLIYRKG